MKRARQERWQNKNIYSGRNGQTPYTRSTPAVVGSWYWVPLTWCLPPGPLAASSSSSLQVEALKGILKQSPGKLPLPCLSLFLSPPLSQGQSTEKELKITGNPYPNQNPNKNAKVRAMLVMLSVHLWADSLFASVSLCACVCACGYLCAYLPACVYANKYTIFMNEHV